jgi:hypothetical protein
MAHLPPLMDLAGDIDYARSFTRHYDAMLAPVARLLAISTLTDSPARLVAAPIYPAEGLQKGPVKGGGSDNKKPCHKAKKFAQQLRDDLTYVAQHYKVEKRWRFFADFNAVPSHSILNVNDRCEDAFESLTVLCEYIHVVQPLLLKVCPRSSFMYSQSDEKVGVRAGQALANRLSGRKSRWT